MGKNMRAKSTKKNWKKHKKVDKKPINCVQLDTAFQRLAFINNDKSKVIMLWEKMR